MNVVSSLLYEYYPNVALGKRVLYLTVVALKIMALLTNPFTGVVVQFFVTLMKLVAV